MSTWLLLRGLAREHAHWGEFEAAFRRAVPQASIVALDLPGNGDFNRVASPARVEAIADACRGALRARRGTAGDAPVYLLAMSLGAMVAIEWARRWPSDVAGCVLINTSLRPFSPPWRRLRPRNWWRLLAIAAGAGTPIEAESGILRLTSTRRSGDAEVVARWAAIRAARPVSVRNALRQLLAAARYRAPRARPGVPMLLLASRGDALVDPRCTGDLARAWGLAPCWHPDAGHDLPLDDPAWVADAVARWLPDDVIGA
ncbi:MAG: alpha/beta fold hydrolase [Lautropia sp.]